MSRQASLSVIVTALNEEKNVYPFLMRLRSFLEENDIRHDVIFVDDGSTDKTFSEAGRLQTWNQLKVLKLTQNRGSGGAIKEGLKLATSEWYAWMPCDLEILPEELLKPYKLIDNKDVVITYFSTGRESRSWNRRIMSLFFTSILNFSFGLRLPYYNGLSLIRRNLINPAHISSNGFFFHAELLIRTLCKTKKFATVPIHLTPRLAEKPKALKFKVLKDVVVCFTRTFWEVKFSDARSHH